MYCNRCGEPLEADLDFCPRCGKRIPADLAERQADRPSYDRTLRRVLFYVSYVLRAAIIILLILAAVWGIRKAASYGWERITAEPEAEEIDYGPSSITDLTEQYLYAASDNNADTIAALFFPGSENLYQNSSGTLSSLQILEQEDACTGYYGETVQSYALGKARFADLESENTAAVVETILSCGGVTDVNEIYNVSVSVVYEDGTTASMTFEVMQCSLGCYLVQVS